MCHCWPRRRTATQIRVENETRTSTECHLLEELEKKEKLFAAYDLLTEAINGFTIQKYINSYLEELLGCELGKLRDPGLVHRICLAFFKQKNLISEWQNNSKLPLFEGLLLAYICHKMRKQFKSIHEQSIADKYEELRNELDCLCKELLENCFKESEEETRQALELNYHKFIHSGDCDEKYKKHEIKLMELAYIGKANNFLASPACQKAIDQRWQPSYRIGQTSLWLYIYHLTFFPFFFEKTEPHAKNPEEDRKIRICNFYKSTSSKYVLHMVFRFAYVLLYSVALVRLSGKSILRLETFSDFLKEFWEQIAILFWQLFYLIETLVIIFDGKFINWARRNMVTFLQHLLISVNLFLFIIALILPQLRFILLPIADLCFYLSYIIAVIRSMKILNVDAFFGSIVYMINKMTQTMIKFFLIFLFFWSAFAVCYISLSGHFHEQNSTYTSLPWQVFYHGAFEIFGEAVDDDKKGYIESCKGFNLKSYTDSSLHCLFRTWTIPLLLFFYMLVSGILLVNILTAFLTKQYDQIYQQYDIYWKVALYARLAEYEDKPFCPVPLSILYYIFYYLVIAISKIAKGSCIYLKSCRESPTTPSNSIEMASLVRSNPPTPTLMRSPADNIPTKAFTQNKEETEERPKDLVLPPPSPKPEIKRKFKNIHGPRPHSAIDMPSSSPPFSRISPSQHSSEIPGSPVEALENAMEQVSSIVQVIVEPGYKTLDFIQGRNEEMVFEKKTKTIEHNARKEMVEQILRNFEPRFTERPRLN